MIINVLNELFVVELIGLGNPLVGFPLGDEDAVGGGYLLLGDEGSELVATEDGREAVNELRTAGVGCEVDATGLEVFEGFAPTLEQHAQDVVGHEVINSSASPLNLVEGSLIKLAGRSRGMRVEGWFEGLRGLRVQGGGIKYFPQEWKKLCIFAF